MPPPDSITIKLVVDVPGLIVDPATALGNLVAHEHEFEVMAVRGQVGIRCRHCVETPPGPARAFLSEGSVDDAEFVRWIADRFVHVVGESPHVDFVQRLRNIAVRMVNAGYGDEEKE